MKPGQRACVLAAAGGDQGRDAEDVKTGDEEEEPPGPERDFFGSHGRHGVNLERFPV